MKILNTKQAAEILSVDPSQVRRLILEGKLPAEKLGRDWLIKEKDLALVANRKRGRPPAKKGRKRSAKKQTEG